MPMGNKEYWTRKIENNKKRDSKVNEYYKSNKWFIIRIWEHDLKHFDNFTLEDLNNLINAIMNGKPKVVPGLYVSNGKRGIKKRD